MPLILGIHLKHSQKTNDNRYLWEKGQQLIEYWLYVYYFVIDNKENKKEK
jgi:hypothetical protein